MSSNIKMGDLVWAKMKGFCPWPGMISASPPELKNQKKAPNSHYVYFFGTNNYAVVKNDSIKPYEEFKETFTKNIKLASLKHAVDEIEDYRLNPKKHPLKGPTKNLKNELKSSKTPKLLAKTVKNKIVVPKSNKKRLMQKVLKNNKNVQSQRKDKVTKKEAKIGNKRQTLDETQAVTKLENKENDSPQSPMIQLCNIRVVVERNVFQCQTCNKIFSSNSKLNIHKRIHSIKTQKKLHKTHNTIKNKISKRPKIKIRLQMKKFDLKTAMRNNVKKSPLNNLKQPKKFVCPFCERIMVTEYNLQAHMKLHDEGGLSCHVCGKTFSHQYELKGHLKRHQGVRDHICPLCEKGFFDKKGLNRHLRSHSDVRPFSCEYCEKTFKDSNSLKRHSVNHLDVKD